jgi:hypothetical protein
MRIADLLTQLREIHVLLHTEEFILDGAIALRPYFSGDILGLGLGVPRRFRL